jgi:hypothetical protein
VHFINGHDDSGSATLLLMTHDGIERDPVDTAAMQVDRNGVRAPLLSFVRESIPQCKSELVLDISDVIGPREKLCADVENDSDLRYEFGPSVDRRWVRSRLRVVTWKAQ